MTVMLLVLARDHGKDVVGRGGEVARFGYEGEGRNHLFWVLPFVLQGTAKTSHRALSLTDTLESVFKDIANDLKARYRSIVLWRS
ncbi:MAG TPA: hypothetical protein VE225_07215 [Rubrobacteraceae bacterium]|jgi:hypothetical protein|nr:hypothetical protein [Rubrobacteraceae bacterium]